MPVCKIKCIGVVLFWYILNHFYSFNVENSAQQNRTIQKLFQLKSNYI